MLDKLKQRWQGNRVKAATMVVVASSCFALGWGISPGMHLPSTAAAEAMPVRPAAAYNSSAPASFSDLAANLSPTVVNVKVVKVEKVGSFQAFPGFPRGSIPEGPLNDFFKKFFEEMPNMPSQPRNPQGPTLRGAGSGVIISKDGYVLTNNHVVEGAKDVTVTLADHQEYKARIVGRDPKTDLAVLKVDAREALPVASLGDSDGLKVGDWVMAIGNPFGLNNTVTSGIVSAKGRVIGAGPYDNFIQTDASINPGNSGGPLFNMNGEVVGINTAIIAQGQGIGFAIPVNTVKPLLPQLETKGAVTRGYLGVSIQTITPQLEKAMQLSSQKGALVADVTAGGPADKAGLKRYDIIAAYNGKAVADSHDLPAMVAGTPIGQAVTVTVLRNGQKMEVPVKVGELPAERAERGSNGEVQPAQAKWGLQLQDLTPKLADQLNLQADKGVLVAGVEAGSKAEDAGVQQGDVILEVNRQPVDSVQEAMNKINSAQDKNHLLLFVQRGLNKLFVPLENVG
jgi:serine protease Do